MHGAHRGPEHKSYMERDTSDTKNLKSKILEWNKKILTIKIVKVPMGGKKQGGKNENKQVVLINSLLYIYLR